MKRSWKDSALQQWAAVKHSFSRKKCYILLFYRPAAGQSQLGETGCVLHGTKSLLKSNRFFFAVTILDVTELRFNHTKSHTVSWLEVLTEIGFKWTILFSVCTYALLLTHIMTEFGKKKNRLIQLISVFSIPFSVLSKIKGLDSSQCLLAFLCYRKLGKLLTKERHRKQNQCTLGWGWDLSSAVICFSYTAPG